MWRSLEVGKALYEAFDIAFFLEGDVLFFDIHEHEADEHRNEADEIHPETNELAVGDQEDARNGGPHHSRRVKDGGIESNGIGKVLLLADEGDQECLAAEDVEGVDDALDEAQKGQQRDGFELETDDEGEQPSLYHEAHLGDEDELVFLVLIHEGANEGREDERGQQGNELYKAEPEDGACHLINQPTDGYPLHPGAQQGNRLPNDVQAKVGVRK